MGKSYRATIEITGVKPITFEGSALWIASGFNMPDGGIDVEVHSEKKNGIDIFYVWVTGTPVKKNAPYTLRLPLTMRNFAGEYRGFVELPVVP